MTITKDPISEMAEQSRSVMDIKACSCCVAAWATWWFIAGPIFHSSRAICRDAIMLSWTFADMSSIKVAELPASTSVRRGLEFTAIGIRH